MTDIIDRQLQLEQDMVDLGVTRYRSEQPMPWRESSAGSKEETELRPGKELLRRTLLPMVERIESEREALAAKKARRGKPASYGPYLDLLNPEIVAYVTAHVSINGAAKGKQVSTLALQISNMLDEHVQFEEFAEADPGLLKHTENKLKTSHARHRRAVLRHALKLTDVTGLKWTEGDKLILGVKLIEMFEETANLVEIVKVRKGRQTKMILKYTEGAAEWLSRQHDLCALLAPMYLPMVSKPREWTNPKDGGYLNKRLIKMDMIKVHQKAALDEYFNVDMPEVYAAVNTLQNTGWRINRNILNTVRMYWDADIGGFADLPARTDDPIPARPAGIPADCPLSELSSEQQRSLKAWKRKAAEAYKRNGKAISQRMAVAQKLWVAEKFVDEEAIYFPYTLDFRGRIYAVPPLVNPQSDDLGKALLEFSEGKPLGNDGAYWLCVHIANLFGEDKVPFDDRVQWTLDHHDQLVDSALNGGNFWLDADKPWAALAACFEYAGWCEEGDDFVSHLPIAMDGSCSGLQHYSAMLRDPIGGAAVNLKAQHVKSDIYSEVAERVSLRLDDPTLADIQVCQAWKGKVVRKICKQPCMTFAYSVTTFGMRDQIVDALKKLDPTGQYLEGVDYGEAATFLAPIVRECIRETVVAAAGAMDWVERDLEVAVRSGHADSLDDTCRFACCAVLPEVDLAAREGVARRQAGSIQHRTADDADRWSPRIIEHRSELRSQFGRRSPDADGQRVRRPGNHLVRHDPRFVRHPRLRRVCHEPDAARAVRRHL